LGAAIERGDTNTGDDLLRDFSIDESGLWLYGAALHVWKAGRHGDAKRLLRRAIRANRRVVKYLAGSAEWPEERPMFYRPGDESEAIIIAHQLGDLWLSIPGAALWLKAQAKRK
jgi:hypothetical protein